MSIHFLAALVGALLAAGGCGMLGARCLRSPSTGLVAWAVALAGLTVSLGAQALGYDSGFWATAFRVMEIGAGVVAPLALALGLAEVAARSLATRFAARLILSALALVSCVVLATDPLSSTTFTKVWPDPEVYYQLVANHLLEDLVAPVTVLVTLIAVATAAARQGRSPAWRDAFAPVAVAGLAALVLSAPGIADAAKVHLPLASGFVLLCILAAGATWLAGVQASNLQLDLMRGDARAGGRRTDTDDAYGPGADDDDEFGIYRGSSRRGGAGEDYRGGAGRQGDGYPDPAGYPGEAGYRDPAGYPDQADYLAHPGYRDDPSYPGQGYAGDAGYSDHDPGYPGQGGYPDDTGFGDQARYRDDTGYPGRDDYADSTGLGNHAGYPDQAYAGHDAGYPAEAAYRDQAGYPDPGPASRDGDSQMFGQIAIYTLLEDCVEDFDRLTRRVVRQVREQEPDTLVYIVHAVPAAPMQRILYEVYRDRAAYEEHKRQPYVAGFEADRRPYVLATNVIELGLQQAKVSPLPSLTDLLSDTGYDLLEDTGFGQPGYAPRRNPRRGGDLPGGGRGSPLR
jgi:quinol monooxygenase YgiN